MGDYWTNAVRHPEDVGVGHIRRTVAFDTTGIQTAPGVPIGALEAGAIPMRVSAYVHTLWNGTTPVLEVGFSTDPDALAKTADLVITSAGWKSILVATGVEIGKPLAANTIIYATVTAAGATAGKMVVMVEFVNKREIDGVPFPNN